MAETGENVDWKARLIDASDAVEAAIKAFGEVCTDIGIAMGQATTDRSVSTKEEEGESHE